jgi:hypothetical protein
MRDSAHFILELKSGNRIGSESARLLRCRLEGNRQADVHDANRIIIFIGLIVSSKGGYLP